MFLEPAEWLHATTASTSVASMFPELVYQPATDTLLLMLAEK